DDRDRRQVGGKGGPGAVVDLRDVAAEVVADLQVLSVRDTERPPLRLDADPEPLEGRHDRDEVAGLDLLDRDLAGGDRAEADEARYLDVVAADPVLAAAELRAALDAQDVRGDPVDVRTERDEEAAEVLDVRLAGGV